jgi:glycosyltransferase involved in cell wall biosynthesis
MERLLSDRGLRERLVANASARVHEFSLEKSIEDTDRLYDRLLSARSRSSAPADASGSHRRAAR